MNTLPVTTGLLHFVGIGGIGMSGIAEILHNLGYEVQGSDANESANVKRLQKLGIKVMVGHDAAHIEGAHAVIISSAVKSDNVEVMAARAARIPVVKRAEMLAQLMRLKWAVAVAGTHGKTTTTSMVAAMLEAGGMDPTVINGGIINAYGTNARLGQGEWMAVEADESDGTFTKLPATVAIVTNMDPEHLDHFGDFAEVKKAYLSFVQNIPFYGFACLCVDHPEVKILARHITDREIIRYGFGEDADLTAKNLSFSAEGTNFDVIMRSNGQEDVVIENLHLPMVGHHNVLNALAAIGVALRLKLSPAMIRQGFATFQGVKRRFTKTGIVNGVTIVDDYAHHPIEIAAVLNAASLCQPRKVIAVMQPHRYSRLRDLFSEFAGCFAKADTVIIMPVYPAGEKEIDGINHETLAKAMRDQGHAHVLTCAGPDELPQMIIDQSEEGDMVVCLGAGSISQWANDMPEKLGKLSGHKKQSA